MAGLAAGGMNRLASPPPVAGGPLPPFYFLHPDCVPGKAAFDLLLLAGTAVFALCLERDVMVSPAARDFDPADASIAHAYKPESEVTVSGAALIVYALVVPMGVIVLVDGLLRKSRGERTVRRLMFFLFGLAAVVLVTGVGKVAAAALTPDFLARCGLPAGTTGSPLVPGSACTGDANTLRAGRMSFPNTVASVSAYSLGLTSVYLRNHLHVRGARQTCCAVPPRLPSIRSATRPTCALTRVTTRAAPLASLPTAHACRFPARACCP
jgi:hypothetical protein